MRLNMTPREKIGTTHRQICRVFGEDNFTVVQHPNKSKNEQGTIHTFLNQFNF